MAFEQINPTVSEGHKGGGLLGAIVGGLAGLGVGLLSFNPAAGASTGAAVAGAAGAGLAAAGAGSAVGGLAGNAVDPAKAPNVSKSVPVDQSEAPQSELPVDHFQDHPELQLAQIADARAALPMANLPQPQYQQYSDLLNQAHGVLSERLGIGGQS